MRIFTLSFLILASQLLYGVNHLVEDIADSGPDTLREAIDLAVSGDVIEFAPELSGSVITLTSGHLLIDDDITINGLSPIVISGGGMSRIFEVASNAVVTLNELTLEDGSANGDGFPANSGGAILNLGELQLMDCTIRNCSASSGGAIRNESELQIAGSTIHDNSSTGDSGAIFTKNLLNASNSTFSNNSSTGLGGMMINEFGVVTLTHCTVFGNQSGGVNRAIFNEGTLTLKNTVIGWEGGAGDPGFDVFTVGGATTALEGVNLLSTINSSGLTAGENLIVALPLLGELADNGGPTLTRLPLTGSPLIDAGGSIDPGGLDQRGFPRFFAGALDIGAVELQDDPLSLSLDSDGDGVVNGMEVALGTNPRLADLDHQNHFRFLGVEDGLPQFSFGYVDDRFELRLKRATDLMDFSHLVRSSDGPAPLPVQIDGSLLTVIDGDSLPAEGRAFYRLEIVMNP
jgi:hypothetical protein